nr:hypothetical protein [Streptomyces varsoviensis]
MHSYDPSSRNPYQHQIPGMRPSHDGSADHHGSATPIYDALYSEYRRSFRALPGDRTGEADLAFTAFGRQQGSGAYPGHSGRPGYWEPFGRVPMGGQPALPPAPRDGRGRGR